MSKRDGNSTVALETPQLEATQLTKKQATLIVVQGAEIGRDYRMRRTLTTLGRSSESDIRLSDQQASRHHARIEREWLPGSGELEYRISDAGSTNGTFVNSEPARKTELQDGDKIQIGNTVLKFVVLDGIDATFHAEVRDRITYDRLTGLLTKESLYLALESELQRCAGYGLPLAVLMMDLDRFKLVNDTYGHPMGSLVLAEVGLLIRESIRTVDVSARYGGEEFVSYLAETDMTGAGRAAERVRASIDAHRFTLGEATTGVTISIGVAVMPQHGSDLETLVAAADRALYVAKENGRNRVSLA